MRERRRFGVKEAAISLAAVAALVMASSVVVTPTGRAQESAKGRSLTPEASLTLRTISDLQFSPDGSRLAFVVNEPPTGTTRPRHIWVYEKKSGAARQFTFSAKNELSPRWSPDGKQLAFLSNRGDDQQIYVMRLEGGEGVAITKGKRSVRSFEWSPDGKQIAFLAPDAKSDEEEKKQKDKDDAHVTDKEDKHSRVWVMNAAGGDAVALTKANWKVDELVWTPTSDRLILKATDRPQSDEHTQRIFSLVVRSSGNTGAAPSENAPRQMLAPQGPFGELRMSPDGKVVSFVGAREDGPSPHDLWFLPLAAHAGRNLTGASLDLPVMDYHWLKDGSVMLVAAKGFSDSLVTYSPEAVRQDLAPSPGVMGSVAVSPSGEMAYVSGSATQPGELWLWDQKSAAVQATHLNDSWKQFALAAPVRYKYKSFDGVEIEAALLKPLGSEGKTKLPMIALIHGGPTGRWSDSIETWGQLLATRGYAILYPNIRGSVGYGEKFIESNRGDWGGGDYKDVMAGVQELVDRGVADPQRLAIGGWSYGGYMSEWAITQTSQFKAAVSGAGMANLISEFGTEEYPAGDEWFYGVPWEKPEGFLNSSPFLHLKDAKTPTLVLQGDADTIDPLGQSQELYRGLKRYGVETEMVVYPREPHGFQEEKHLLDRLNRILAWYDKYLKEGAGTTANGK